MKNYSVVSQYKNPDRFIERLKMQLQQSQKDVGFWMNAAAEKRKELYELRSLKKSKEWFSYEKGIEASVSFIPSESDFDIIKNAKLKQTIIGIGEIIELNHTIDKSGAKMLINSVRIVPE